MSLDFARQLYFENAVKAVFLHGCWRPFLYFAKLFQIGWLLK